MRPPFSFRSALTQWFGAAFAVSLFLTAPPASLGYAQTPPADFIFDRSHEVVLTPTQLEGLSRDRLRLARNEIFARRGYIFSSSELRAYFAAKPWYRPVTNDLNKLGLSPTEQANVALIKRFEEQAPAEQPIAASAATQQSIATKSQALPATGDVAAAVRRVDCESLEATVRGQPWNTGGAPFGKPYDTWAVADFDAVNKYAGECTRLLQQRNVPQAGVAATEIYSFLMPLQNALARAGQKKAEEARVEEWREKNRKISEQKATELAKHKARAQELRDAGERFSTESHTNDLKLLGIGPDLIENAIFVRDYMGQPRRFMTFYQFMGHTLSNSNLESVQTRRWDLGGATGNGIEIIAKLPGRQTFGLLFKQDGSDLFPTHFVKDDTPLPFSFTDLNTIYTLLETVAGFKQGELQNFLVE